MAGENSLLPKKEDFECFDKHDDEAMIVSCEACAGKVNCMILRVK